MATEQPPELVPERVDLFRRIVGRIAEADRLRKQARESMLRGPKNRRLIRVAGDEDLLRRAQQAEREAQDAFDEAVFQCLAAAIVALQNGQAQVLVDDNGVAALVRVQPTNQESMAALLEHARRNQVPDAELEVPPMRAVAEEPPPRPKCEGCERTAVTYDAGGVPLCSVCAEDLARQRPDVCTLVDCECPAEHSDFPGLLGPTPQKSHRDPPDESLGPEVEVRAPNGSRGPE